MRINGFDGPLNVWQRGSMGAFSFIVVMFYLVFSPGLGATLQVVWNIIYSLLLVGLAILWHRATSINAIDSGVCPEGPGKWKDEPREEREKRMSERIEGKRWCPYCTDHVFQNSKHCRECDKCVGDFDHHCRWLNNCVGGKNYKEFFFLCCVVMSLLLVQLGIGIHIFVVSYSDGDKTIENYKSLFGNKFSNLDGIRAGVGLSLCIVIPFCLALGQLVGLHIWLYNNGLTTYAWIVQNREKKYRAALEKEKAKQQELTDLAETTNGSAINTPARTPPVVTSIAAAKKDYQTKKNMETTKNNGHVNGGSISETPVRIATFTEQPVNSSMSQQLDEKLDQPTTPRQEESPVIRGLTSQSQTYAELARQKEAENQARELVIDATPQHSPRGQAPPQEEQFSSLPGEITEDPPAPPVL